MPSSDSATSKAVSSRILLVAPFKAAISISPALMASITPRKARPSLQLGPKSLISTLNSLKRKNSCFINFLFQSYVFTIKINFTDAKFQCLKAKQYYQHHNPHSKKTSLGDRKPTTQIAYFTSKKLLYLLWQCICDPLQ